MDADGHRDAGETRVLEMVFPGLANHYGTLFAGHGLALMAKCAFLTATRATRQTYVLARADGCEFLKPVPQGRMVELIGRIAARESRGLLITVELHAEELLTGARQLALRGRFLMVPVDAGGRPTAPAACDHPTMPAQEELGT